MVLLFTKPSGRGAQWFCVENSVSRHITGCLRNRSRVTGGTQPIHGVEGLWHVPSCIENTRHSRCRTSGGRPQSDHRRLGRWLVRRMAPPKEPKKWLSSRSSHSAALFCSKVTAILRIPALYVEPGIWLQSGPQTMDKQRIIPHLVWRVGVHR